MQSTDKSSTTVDESTKQGILERGINHTHSTAASVHSNNFAVRPTFVREIYLRGNSQPYELSLV